MLEEHVSHLPVYRQKEVIFIAGILFEEFQQAQSARSKKILRNGRILKLILFGAHACGSRAEDGCFSGYNFLAVVNKEDFTAPEFWRYAVERIECEWLVTGRIRTPVELICHSYQDVNNQIALGRPFFLDILRNGVMLYEAEGYPFARPGNITAAQRYGEARGYFDEWYALSLSGLFLARVSLGKSETGGDAFMRDAAFLAHQATERIYHCLLLTCTLHSPKMHNIKKLRSFANNVAPGLASVWPQDKKFYKQTFELLRRSYIEARYAPHYKITREELIWLLERIEDLQDRVREVCEVHLQQAVAV